MYLHSSCKKGTLIKRNKNYHNTESETQSKRNNNETVIEKQDNTIVQLLHDASAAKDEETKKDENVSKLILENEGLIKENNKIKIMLKNMDLEIKLLRSRTKE